MIVKGGREKDPSDLIAVKVAFERTLNLDSDVLGLLLAQCRELGTETAEVQPSDLLIKRFWKQVDIVLVRLCLLPVIQKVNLRKHLVRE